MYTYVYDGVQKVYENYNKGRVIYEDINEVKEYIWVMFCNIWLKEKYTIEL